MSMSINNVVSKYVYTNSKTGQTRVNLDTSADGVWSEKEVESYAAEYEQATGKAVDAKAVFDRYDSDKSGTLDYSEYDAAITEDALGIGQLMELHSAQQAADGEAAIEDTDTAEGGTSVEDSEAAGNGEAAESEEAAGSETEPSTDVAGLMANLSPAQRVSLVKATFQAESAANLINSMLNPGAAISSLNSALSSYTGKMAANTLGSTFDTLA